MYENFTAIHPIVEMFQPEPKWLNDQPDAPTLLSLEPETRKRTHTQPRSDQKHTSDTCSERCLIELVDGEVHRATLGKQCRRAEPRDHNGNL